VVLASPSHSHADIEIDQARRGGTSGAQGYSTQGGTVVVKAGANS